MLTFREMSMDDLPSVMRIENENFSSPWSETSFFSFFIRDDNYFCSAFEDGELIGYAGLTLVPPEGDLVNIAVDGANQGRGVGKKLLAFLLEEGRKRGVTDVFLEVRVSNTPARRLYEHFGFEYIAVRKAYYENPVEDAQIMKRTEK